MSDKSSKKKKKVKSSTLFFMSSVGIALVVAFMGASSISAAKKEVQIVEAATNIPAYTKITADQVKLVTVAQEGVPADAYKSVDQVVNKYTGIALEADAPLRSGEIASGVDRPAGLLARANEQKRLVMISIPSQKSDLALGIQPGDHVNIIGLIKNNQEIKEKRVDDVEVVKIEDGDKNTANGPNLWVDVPPDQTDIIHEAVAGGIIRLELLPKGGSSH